MNMLPVIQLEFDHAALAPLEGEINKEALASDVGISGLGGHTDAVFIVAKIGERPIGCATLSMFISDRCELLKLYVSPDHRRHGLATSLVHAAIGVAKDRGVAWLHLEISGCSRAFWAKLLDGRSGEYDPPHVAIDLQA